MDPNTVLEFIRTRAKDMAVVDNGWDDDVMELASAFISLDEWINNGGFLPEAWNLSRPVGRPRHTNGSKLEGVPHGNRGSYNKGCRCLPCTAANRIGRNLNLKEMQEYGYDN